MSVSPEAEALLGKIRETAAECHPERIALVAHIDAIGEGEQAEILSRERVDAISGKLVAAGLPAASIRVAAAEADNAGKSLHQVDVMFLKADDAEPPKPAATAAETAI